MKKLCIAVIALLVVSFGSAQSKSKSVADTIKASKPAEKPLTEAPKSAPKPYKEVITEKAITRKGFFTVHKVDEKYFLEIPPSLLGRDILVINRVSKSSVQSPKGFSGYAGDQIGDNVIRFEKGPNNKMFLKNIFYNVNPDSSKPMYKSVVNSNIQPIAMAFDVKAIASDSLGKGVVIDITDHITADNEIFGFASFAKQSFKAGAFQADKSYIVSVRPYPTNIEITTVKTFAKSPDQPFPGMPPTPPGNATVTLEMNSSLVLLPAVPMKPRFEDPRVGYFGTGYTDFDANPQGVKDIEMIARWRLEPKPGDMEKYKKGELVEPAKQIVFYIDPSTPKNGYLI